MQFLNFENRPRNKEMNYECYLRKMRVCLLINALFFILMRKLRAARP